jgi:hypothetical protein
MAFTLFVGDVLPYLNKVASLHDSSAYIITNKNLNHQPHTGTGYVSLGDLKSIEHFFNLLAQANLIVYAPPPENWSDNKTIDDPFSMAWLTLHYINIVSSMYKIPTQGLPDIIPHIELNKRKTDYFQFWIAGCSTTYGIGVSQTQRYCEILKNQTNIDFTLLAKPCSSIPWSGDQILNSELRSGDIVIWGLTTVARFYWYENNIINHVAPSYYHQYPEFNQVIPIDLLSHPHRLYDALSSITQVENMCSQIGVKLILVGIHNDLEVSSFLAKKDNFIMIHGTKGADFNDSLLDFGSDNQHPGPLTHKFYADKILKKLIDLKWIPNNSSKFMLDT